MKDFSSSFFVASILSWATLSCYKPSIIKSNKIPLGLLNVASSALRLSASATWLASYSKLKSNSARKSCHLACS